MTAFVLAIVVKASLVMAAAAAINGLLRHRASAAWRHMVWAIAASALLLLPVLTVALPGWQVPIRVAAAPSVVATTPAVVTDPSDLRSRAANQTPAGVLSKMDRDSFSGKESRSIFAAVSWPAMAGAGYLIGVLLLLARLLVERAAIERIARRSATVVDAEWVELLGDCQRGLGLREPIRLLRSIDRSMPMAFGVRRPTILIPSIADTWTDDRRRAVLLHELAHIARRDCLTQFAASVGTALYWMHPGAWWVARQLRIERELACDDRVLLVGTVARDYAEHLLELAYTLGGYRAPALAVSMARPRQLEGRMLAVLDSARCRTTPARRARIVGFVIAAVVVVPLAAAETMLVPDTTMFVAENGAKPSLDLAPVAPLDQREARRAVNLPGTWEIRLSKDGKQLHLQLRERINSSRGFTIAIDQLNGLSPALLTGAGGSAQFSIRRDAGTIEFEGTFRSGVGAGTYSFAPSQTFPAEMTRRGFARPTADDQYRLAVSNIGFAYLDELNAQKYARPDLDLLVRAGDHGVDFDYLRGMGRAGHRLGQLEPLIKMRDHGVDPEYISEMAAAGYSGLSGDELVRARDHGVDPEYAGAMKGFGFARLSLEGLVNARDHGVDDDYVRAMRKAGFELTLPELIRARDHGVDSEFAQAMSSFGFQRLSLDDLVNARGHGVDQQYVRDMRKLGHSLSLYELRNARDHGVDTEFARAIGELGYKEASIDELIRMRDHGVTPDFVRRQNSRRIGRLSIEELVRIRDRGGN